jgi:SAM-dependent methyltransferase
VLQQEFSPTATAAIYITEQVTPAYKWIKAHFPNCLGSEYFPGHHRSGDFVNGLRHQDVQELSFRDDEFEYILTFDVLEHVPHFRKALREFFRCLRPKGVLLITVPFLWNSYEHQVRAELRDDGKVEHFMEPEFHGNPMNMERGSLRFRYFGWRLIDELSEIGFSNVEVLFYWSEQLRYFGDSQLIVTARKP